MSVNGISTSTVSGDPTATKIQRRNQKLALATWKRSSVTTSTWYRTLHTITGTHVAYVNGALSPLVSGTTSPATGHPWI
jgi:hypothetical protein